MDVFIILPILTANNVQSGVLLMHCANSSAVHKCTASRWFVMLGECMAGIVCSALLCVMVIVRCRQSTTGLCNDSHYIPRMTW